MSNIRNVTFIEFVQIQDWDLDWEQHNTPIEPIQDTRWAEDLINQSIFTPKHCDKQSSVCPLCMVEALLVEYREHSENNTLQKVKYDSIIDKDKWDVHKSHCCLQHGCKYGSDLECPVASGFIEQKYPCEICKSI